MSSASRSSPREAELNGTDCRGAITLKEWQGWGCVSPVPAMVNSVIKELKLLENNIDSQMVFGGNGGKLQGDFKVQEDKKHRAKYETLGDSDKKFQFFSARQIACRLLGSRGYLCQKCWLPMEDDFLRQNNTGKLLWQVFGVQSATLCLYGISEDEEIMWNAFKDAGKDKVWCLYPNQNTVPKTVQDAFSCQSSAYMRCAYSTTNRDRPLNFVLIDGTWSNSAAMFRRLKEQAKLVWGEEDLPCVSLATGASAMHKLRPQPSWDRTCTAAAAIGVLSELQLLPECSVHGLDKQADAVEDALVVLLEALTTRRLRMGRSITRKVRHSRDIC
ncbi:DNA-directed RNA polymerase II subunit RPB2 [Hibiscus syriacus]|uniref:tRNA-uridine aminocarboxypropyltransferase n=1 Tax=Hibiscus syriacus TaxID=106335 RepID=A0A6A2Z461_HIBSY|nr:DNA-directed RNA polymerase II subunit RPB2 [Hibiscus syriacus]